MLADKLLYVATDKEIDVYKIQSLDLKYESTIEGVHAHSIFSVTIYLIVQEFYTNNLKIYRGGELYKEFKGKAPSLPTDFDLQFEIKNIDNKTTFIWYNGPKSLALVDIESHGSLTEIDHFWDSTEVGAVDPINIIMNIKPEKIIALALKNKDKYFIRTYQLDKKKARSFLIDSYMKDLSLLPGYEATAIEKSQRTNIFFMAAFQEGYSTVYQLQPVTEGLSLVSSAKILIDDFERIIKLRGFHIGKNDYLICNGTNSIVLLKNEEKSLSVFYTFQNMFLGVSTDTCIYKNKFFNVNKNSSFINEISAANKVEEGELHQIQEDADILMYEKYNVSKIPIPKGISRSPREV